MTVWLETLREFDWVRWAGWVKALLATSVFGTVYTGMIAFARARAEESANRAESIRSTRLALYAQLHRIVEISYGHLKYLRARSEPLYMWVPIFEINLSTPETIRSLSSLTAIEVYEVTSSTTLTTSRSVI